MIGNLSGTRFLSYLITGVLLALHLSCAHPEKKPPASEKGTQDSIVIKNFGETLFNLAPLGLKYELDSLKDEFSFFLGDSIDTLQFIQLKEFILDPFNRELAEKCQETYPDKDFLSAGLARVFGMAQEHFPGFQFPRVYTYVSGLMYEQPVQYVDTVMVIALDMFLGWDYPPYRAAGIPVYMTRRMERQNILPECAREIAYAYIPGTFNPKILLDHMILHGKLLYALDQLLPGTPDSLKIGYTQSQHKWCTENEQPVWRILMDQELLYKSDPHLKARFIQDGPFTSGLPDGAPAMLGRWIGWQIVRSYMQKNPQVSLMQLFQAEDSQAILAGSGYKPKK